MIKLGNGEWEPAQDLEKGWFRIYHATGAIRQRVIKLGVKTYVDKKKNKWKCKDCGHILFNKQSLAAHKHLKHCRPGMTKAELAKCRAKRQMNAKSQGANDEYEEQLAIFDTEKRLLKNCSKFKYLGVILAPSKGQTGELTRRSAMARSACGRLKKMWKCRRMKRKTKKQFFDSLVLAILLYAAETWILKDHERKLIEREYIRLARHAFSSWRKVDQDGKWEANEYFLKQNGLEELMKIVARRKATWIGHLKRRTEDEWAKKFLEERNDELSDWWKITKQELAECSVTVDQVLEAAPRPQKIRELFK